MTEAQFSKLIEVLSEDYEVDFSSKNQHAFIEMEGWQVSFSYLGDSETICLSLAPEYKMPLGKFTQFLSRLNEILELLFLKEKRLLQMPGSYVPGKKGFDPMVFTLPRSLRKSGGRRNRIERN